MSGESRLYQNFINGEFVPAACGETIDVTNPATNAVVGRIPRSKAEDVDAGKVCWAIFSCKTIFTCFGGIVV